MLLKNTVLLVVLAHTCMCIVITRHGYEYYPVVDGWMKLHKEPTDWFNARIQCHMEGAFLASPWSEQFISAVFDAAYSQSLLDGMDPDMFFTLREMYSGVKTTYAEGAFTFSDGKPIISVNPKDLAQYERCGILVSDGHTRYVPCDVKLPYVCYTPESEAKPKPDIGLHETALKPEIKIDPLDSTLNSVCGGKSPGFEFSNETGHCYKFHTQAAYTWFDAKLACEEEEARLAIVNSNEEAKVLANLFQKYPSYTITSAQYTDTAAIGFSAYTTENWETIDGQTLEQAGYSSWLLDPPYFESAKFGFICRDGLLYGYDSLIRRMLFICEKEPTASKSLPKNEPESTPESIEDNNGYKTIDETGQCYKLHEETVNTLDEADRVCETEGANLAVVDEDKAILLVESFYTLKYILKPFNFSFESNLDYAFSEMNVWEFTKRDGLLYAYDSELRGGVRQFICEKKISEPQHDTVTGPAIETDAVSEPEYETVTEPEITDAVSEPEYEIITEPEITDAVSKPEYGIVIEPEITDAVSEPEYEIVTEPEITDGVEPVYEIVTEPEITDAVSEPQHDTVTGPAIETNAVSEPEDEIVTEPEIKTELEPALDLRENNLGYESFGQTEHYYKLHEQAVYNLEEAQEICEAEGAQLGIVDRDNFFLFFQIFEKYPPKQTVPETIGDFIEYDDDLISDEYVTKDDTMYAYYSISRGNAKRFICEKTISGLEPDLETGTKPEPEIKAKAVSEPKYETEIDIDTKPILESESSTESTLTLASQCGESFLGYELSHQTGHCYKFHAPAVKTWYAAKSVCEEEGAHLAIINSDQEAQVIIKLFEKYPPEKIFGAEFPDTAAIGYFKTVRNGWQTIEGETLKQAGYEAWRPDAPHVYAEYGFICRDGLLYGYVSAVRDMSFICEKKPL